jgi:putative endonuclease
VPRIPVLQPQQSPSGFLQPGRVESSAPDLSGLVRGINQRTVNLQRDEAQFEHELQVQERQREVADTAAAREQYLSIKDLLADGYEEHQAGVLDGSIDKTSALTKWSERTKALIDLYIGISDDPQRRLEEHNTRKGSVATRRGTYILVFLEEYSTRAHARMREIQLKKWRREKKEMLITRYTAGLPTKISS